MDKKSTCKLPARGSNRIQTTKKKSDTVSFIFSPNLEILGWPTVLLFEQRIFFQNDHLNPFWVYKLLSNS